MIKLEIAMNIIIMVADNYDLNWSIYHTINTIKSSDH